MSAATDPRGTPASRAADVVARAVADVADQLAGERRARPVDPDDRLVGDLGFDSLALYEVAVRLDDHVPGFELPEGLAVADVTVRDVAHYLALAAGHGGAEGGQS